MTRADVAEPGGVSVVCQWLQELYTDDFQGTFATEGLEVPAGVLVGSSFRTPPGRYPKIARVEEGRDSDRFHCARSIAVHFGIELGLERRCPHGDHSG